MNILLDMLEFIKNFSTVLPEFSWNWVGMPFEIKKLVSTSGISVTAGFMNIFQFDIEG